MANTSHPIETTTAASMAGPLFLLAGSTVIVLTDALAGTALSMARLDMMGGTHASADEFAKLDYGYTAAKLIAFSLTPWLAGLLTLYRCVVMAGVVMTAACFGAAHINDLELLFGLRLLQGMSGGVLLTGTQALLFRSFTRKHQPVVQSIYAVGAVVAPATLAPYMHGWLLDRIDWSFIFLWSVPFGIAGIAMLALSPHSQEVQSKRVRFDLEGLLLFTVAASSFTYVLNQGNRWDWFNDRTIVIASAAGFAALGLQLIRQFCDQPFATIFNFTVFRNANFAFGIVASLAAGFALLGSSFVIPSFAVSVLKMTPVAAGSLLLPSTLTFIGSLFLTAFLIQKLNLPGIVTVPFGILGLMFAMWLLSASSGDSGITDMTPAILIRGLALGFLFLSITLVTLMSLDESLLLYGVALFNIGRQVGGLVAISFLQTFIEDQTAYNRAVLAAHIHPGSEEVIARIGSVSRLLSNHGLEFDLADKTAVSLISKQVALQATTIAFDTAFFAITIFFLAAAPCLILWKIALGRIHPAKDRA
ncbi:MFS transporter [Neorhizobium petrolearium]|uniref:MFS transporter n=1 Tax=Neorhizobium petrolearium TaxID=515361 RepID=A0ABY8LV11_9HYPH|nr:MFS transporter [Neorhizobium petrolearium]MCC2610942.1 MFS transporter [Neorhizobium petrolearium]WGI66163.1 MFS transporter [Neorhizobium petrolearium]